jgi:hypothetical protein
MSNELQWVLSSLALLRHAEGLRHGGGGGGAPMP